VNRGGDNEDGGGGMGESKRTSTHDVVDVNLKLCSATKIMFDIATR